MSSGTPSASGTPTGAAPATAPAPTVPADWPAAGDEIVTDASLWVNAALSTHPYHAPALAFVTHCATVGVSILAPPLWESEVDSSIRRAKAIGQIKVKAMRAALAFVDTAPVAVRYESATRRAARALADVIKAPRVYDSTYGALAQAHGCVVWTADARFFNAASAAGLTFVKFIGAYPVPSVPSAPGGTPSGATSTT